MAESLGDDDPALRAYPAAPVHVIFDEPLLERRRLSGTRLGFLSKRLADLPVRMLLPWAPGKVCAACRPRRAMPRRHRTGLDTYQRNCAATPSQSESA